MDNLKDIIKRIWHSKGEKLIDNYSKDTDKCHITDDFFLVNDITGLDGYDVDWLFVDFLHDNYKDEISCILNSDNEEEKK